MFRQERNQTENYNQIHITGIDIFFDELADWWKIKDEKWKGKKKTTQTERYCVKERVHGYVCNICVLSVGFAVRGSN